MRSDRGAVGTLLEEAALPCHGLPGSVNASSLTGGHHLREVGPLGQAFLLRGGRSAGGPKHALPWPACALSSHAHTCTHSPHV